MALPGRPSMLAAMYYEFGGPITVQRLSIPNCELKGVLLRVKATGICRSDWHGWKGHDDDIQQLPFVPGHEVSGEIVQVGAAVKRFRVGDRVAVPFILSCGCCEYCKVNKPTVCLDQKQPGFTHFGSLAEYVSIPRADWNLVRLPRNVTFPQAAALGCRFSTAYRAVIQQGRLQSHQSIVVFGCGGVGLSCIMLAQSIGCHSIVAVDVSDDALQRALQLGATHAVQSSGKNNQDATVKRIEEITDGGGHVCVEASGVASHLAVTCTRRGGGRMIQVGLLSTQSCDIPMNLVVAREVEVVGSHGFAAVDLGHLLQLVSDRKLDPSRLVERTVDLQGGGRAIEDMDKGSSVGITMVVFPESRL